MASFRPKELTPLGSDGQGWQVYAYQGAIISTRDGQVLLGLLGHPMNGANVGTLGAAKEIVDHWLVYSGVPAQLRGARKNP